jgi:nucleoside-triphosphatase
MKRTDRTSKNVLLTGSPGCGKTTVILRLVDLVRDLRLAGFHTQELRQRGQRVGFEAVGLSSGLRTVLAHTGSRSRTRVGRYGVEPANLEPLVRAELVRPPDGVNAYFIDEIGKMELFCPAFVAAVPGLLEGPVPVVATVARKGRGLIEQVKVRTDSRLLHVSEKTRDRLPKELATWLRNLVQAD